MGALEHPLAGVDPKDRAPGRSDGVLGHTGADAADEDLVSGSRGDDVLDQQLRVAGDKIAVEAHGHLRGSDGARALAD
jgi:hypothetical protein